MFDYSFWLSLTLQALMWVSAAWLVVALSSAIPLWSLWQSHPEKLDPELARQSLEQVFQSGYVTSDWTDAADFHPVDLFQLKTKVFTPVLANWKRRSERTYLCVYLIGNIGAQVDFVSCFDDGRFLTTGTTRDSHLLPLGTSWAQSFDTDGIDELWARHCEALAYLRATENLLPSIVEGSVTDDFLAALDSQKRHLQSLPLWFLRIPY